MDALTTASALATVVGLLGDFAGSRANQKTANLSEFIEWLRDHGHEDLLKAIESSHSTSISIKAALNEGNEQLLSRLATIDSQLATLCEIHGPLGELAESLHPGLRLSEQAKHILMEFERAEAGQALEYHSMRGVGLLLLDKSGEIDIKDERFFQDDIDKLIELGFFRLTYNKQAERILNLTRNASAYAKKLIQEEINKPRQA